MPVPVGVDLFDTQLAIQPQCGAVVGEDGEVRSSPTLSPSPAEQRCAHAAADAPVARRVLHHNIEQADIATLADGEANGDGSILYDERGEAVWRSDLFEQLALTGLQLSGDAGRAVEVTEPA